MGNCVRNGLTETNKIWAIITNNCHQRVKERRVCAILYCINVRPWQTGSVQDEQTFSNQYLLLLLGFCYFFLNLRNYSIEVVNHLSSSPLT